MTHLEEAKRLLAIAESTDAKREAYRAAAEEIAAHKAATKSTNKDIAMSLGRHENVVDRLLGWRKRGYDTDSPYDEGPQKQQQVRARESHARRVLKSPAERKQVLESLTEDEVEQVVATAVESKPKVAQRIMAKSSKAATAMRTAAADDRERRAKEQIKAAQDRAVQARPPATVSQYYWRILNQFTQWHEGLRWIEEEVHTLQPSERPEVIKRLTELRYQIDRCLDAVEGRLPDADDGVIDSRATTIGDKELIAG